MLYHTHRGLFVGEEVGGTDQGNTSGHRWTIELPNSGMRLVVPLLQFRMAWTAVPRGHGVLPNCKAPPEPKEIGERHDHAWRIAVALLKERWTVPRAAVCPTTEAKT